MPPIIIDLVIGLLILGLTYALSSEGLWGSALMFFNIVFAGIIAFNFYEPLAGLLAANVGIISHMADMFCLMVLFVVALVILRLTTETLGPAMVRFPAPLYHAGRFLFALGGSAVTMAILLLAFDTAPVHKSVFGVIDYKYEPPFHMGFEREWLGFFQYTTGQIFASYGAEKNDPYGEYKNARVFDPKAQWLLDHQDARPFGTNTVIEPEAAPAAGGAAGAEPKAAPGPPS